MYSSPRLEVLPTQLPLRILNRDSRARARKAAVSASPDAIPDQYKLISVNDAHQIDKYFSIYIGKLFIFTADDIDDNEI